MGDILEEHEYFRELTGYPETVSGGAIISRLLDGIGFRFYWATDSLRPEDFTFRLLPEVMSVNELIEHIWQTLDWISRSARGVKFEIPPEVDGYRNSVLAKIQDLRDYFENLPDGELKDIIIGRQSFWHMINGPLADMLTHIGQINSFRRVSGNPASQSNPFRGKPPKEN